MKEKLELSHLYTHVANEKDRDRKRQRKDGRGIERKEGNKERERDLKRG